MTDKEDIFGSHSDSHNKKKTKLKGDDKLGTEGKGLSAAITLKEVLDIVVDNPGWADYVLERLLFNQAHENVRGHEDFSLINRQNIRMHQRVTDYQNQVAAYEMVLNKNIELSKIFSEVIGDIHYKKGLKPIISSIKKHFAKVGYHSVKLWSLKQKSSPHNPYLNSKKYKMIQPYLNDRGIYTGSLNQEIKEEFGLAKSHHHFVVIELEKSQFLLTITHKNEEENQDAQNLSLVEIFQNFIDQKLCQIIPNQTQKLSTTSKS